MNLGELVALVADYLNRSDMTTRIPTFIQIAQRKIERGGKYVVNGQEVQINGKYDCMKYLDDPNTSTDRLTVPTGYMETIFLKVNVNGDLVSLTKKTPEEILEKYPNITSDIGVPEEYAYMPDTGDILLRPTPDKAYDFSHYIYQHLTVLALNADTNYWSQGLWEILLYGALLEASPYLMNDARAPLWLEAFGGSLSNLQDDESRSEISGSHLYIKPYYCI